MFRKLLAVLVVLANGASSVTELDSRVAPTKVLKADSVCTTLVPS